MTRSVWMAASIVCGTVLIVASPADAVRAQGSTEALTLNTGDERWQESEDIVLTGKYDCGTARASYRVVINKVAGVTSLRVGVNGKAVNRDSLKTALDEIAAAHGYDYASFSCTRTYYRFAFMRVIPSEGEEIVATISGSLD